MHYKTNDFHIRMKQKKRPQTNVTVDESQKRKENEAKRRLETNINVDVSQKRDNALDRREERAHSAL